MIALAAITQLIEASSHHTTSLTPAALAPAAWHDHFRFSPADALALWTGDLPGPFLLWSMLGWGVVQLLRHADDVLRLVAGLTVLTTPGTPAHSRVERAFAVLALTQDRERTREGGAPDRAEAGPSHRK